MSDFKIDKLGYYETKAGLLVRVIYIGNQILQLDYHKGTIISVFNIPDRDEVIIQLYDENGIPDMGKNQSYISRDQIVKYLSEAEYLDVNSKGIGFYKNRIGNIVKVVSLNDFGTDSRPNFPVVVLQESNRTYYNTNLYGVSNKNPEFDLVQFIEH